MSTSKLSPIKQEYYYKGIYPVEIIKNTSKLTKHYELEIRVRLGTVG